MDQVEIIRRELSFPIQLRNTLFLPSVAVLTRLSTSHCVVKWNRDINTTCAFSNNQLESRDHMLSSEYSALIWFLEKDRLIIQVYIDILEATDGKDLEVSRIKQRLQNIESGFVKNCLEFKSKEISLEKEESDTDASRIKKLEERVNNLELMISDDVNASRIQQQEERIKSLETMMSDLKVGLDTEKAKSCADGFFVVDHNDVLM
ncbi:hypothetical protein YC2023_022605 [Brassica napus]